MGLFLTSKYWALPLVVLFITLFALQGKKVVKQYYNLYLLVNFLLALQMLFFITYQHIAALLLGASAFFLLATLVMARYPSSRVRNKLSYKLPLLGMLLFYTIFRYRGELYLYWFFVLASLMWSPLVLRLGKEKIYYCLGAVILLLGNISTLFGQLYLRDVLYLVGMGLLSLALFIMGKRNEVCN